ncbi:MAG: aspartate aminotransferase [Candidatus Schekmanbacteria bacterium RIFCSPHIGHO2_02_FULL_38_11]|uniref:Aminotransferase n=1 Tax=Candidatus Schekmanbacteria bacterium RIFCSPLOWO2_12_FULL_38_15 TaxID=1817883 RepID=A0A1F7SGE2_9BACT|nr:MAG: aspartate aminotransferase [Candidatus Schekmanbacteria bacterium GWA2_38_9]OGL49333.1 MAG: aspartate aminotransferase [Candidatus Schekmanbacteria bacterium RIFCSPLOWO2_02_FULL_38_14]OGL52811.1 MAG: aspartate aminotransferase [Candidatus Schekmanbacteria bacterium RIFCSPLOWO2_12_FULL_38_15]OGL55250.1 MAG: aspartate aminotransferase [Candidatus Schekmanbacteria bacterium RIFCSPHIGHO2_02_FULL_38_11]
MISSRAKDISPFIVMDVLDEAKAMEKAGEDIIHLEVGEPDFDTPRVIKEEGYRALRNGITHYTHSMGIIELRETIAEHYFKRYGVDVSPNQIIVTSGTSPAMLLVFGALLNQGDEVVLSNPHYSCYPNFIRFVEGIPVFVDIFEKEGFQYDADEFRKKLSKKTKGIVVNSPANPTGAVLKKKVLEELANLPVFVISDEIYHGLIYEGEEHSMLEFTDRAFVLNGFSKLYAMTGWRLGYVIAPKKFVRAMQKLQQNLFISASSFAQWAGISALKNAGKDVKKMVTIFNQRRLYMVNRLRELGFGIKVLPTGAFYVLANAKKFSENSYEFAFKILREAKVAVTPGIDFGTNAEGYIRFSYSNSIENIKEGMRRIEKFIKKI